MAAQEAKSLAARQHECACVGTADAALRTEHEVRTEHAQIVFHKSMV